MAKKTMATSVVNRSVKTGKVVSKLHHERLTDSITGSLRVEGYAVKREAVSAIVRDHITGRAKK